VVFHARNLFHPGRYVYGIRAHNADGVRDVLRSETTSKEHRVVRQAGPRVPGELEGEGDSASAELPRHPRFNEDRTTERLQMSQMLDICCLGNPRNHEDEEALADQMPHYLRARTAVQLGTGQTDPIPRS
jgi:hypothetical protein